MMTVEVVTPPTITPWLLGDAKDHLRERGTENDGYIQMASFAVWSIAERITRRAFYTQTLKYYQDKFCRREIELPRPVLQSITHVKYYDSAGALITMSASDYQVDAKSLVGRICPQPTQFWPPTEFGRINAVEIQYVAGWTTRGAMPEALRQAMLYHLSHLYDMREPVVTGMAVAEVPYTIRALYAPFRVVRYF